jgi:hypothetical protein
MSMAATVRQAPRSTQARQLVVAVTERLGQRRQRPRRPPHQPSYAHPRHATCCLYCYHPGAVQSQPVLGGPLLPALACRHRSVMTSPGKLRSAPGPRASTEARSYDRAASSSEISEVNAFGLWFCAPCRINGPVLAGTDTGSASCRCFFRSRRPFPRLHVL